MKWFLILTALGLIGCGSDTDAIHETDTFLSAEMRNPSDNKVGILKRSAFFARSNGMKLDSSTSHFETGEYSALLKRADLNIFVANVGRGQTTLMTVYVKGKPTDAHRQLVQNYQCVVFYACMS